MQSNVDASMATFVESKTETPSVSSKSAISSKAPVISSTPKHTECSHIYSITTVNATCTADGYETKACTKCGVTNKTVLKATGHKMVNERCSVCGYADVTACRKKVYDWFKASGKTEHYLADSNYYFKASENGSIYFYFNDNSSTLSISVYGWEKNSCYIEYKNNTTLNVIEGEFKMDTVHSSNDFNTMNGSVEGALKAQMITELKGKIDGVLLKFQAEMKTQMGVSLKDIGFTKY